MYACGWGHVAIVKELIAKGADLSWANHEGGTPLSIADEHGHQAVVKLLKSKGAPWYR
ncbi:hypothetical protein DUNSADRAFT_10719 [Dunaliella salina]|uniref:Uncharacterized protein n=1 Tax=Dunaliella salina TaxID=3046 RepID=A0ABQ7FS74_DUNSA|nr:hypothetical protein DUNSADRAFT_10719 [Dunaliella salina]|eukprot:KAF5825389.1 hypothetical protein DUNSADRAFT_10719 [Dunaliella salina]